MTPTSAETKAALEIETEIRLFHIIFWITDSYLKGQRDMSLGKTICHDTMPMYRPEAAPPEGGLLRPVESKMSLSVCPLDIRAPPLFSTAASFLKNSEKGRGGTMLPSIKRSSVKTSRAVRRHDSGSGSGRAPRFSLMSDAG